VGVLVHPGDDLLDIVGPMGEAGVDLIVLEASLGHGPELIDGIVRIKERWPKLPLIGGDVTDAGGACRTLEAGADGVKVGAPYLLGLKVPLFHAIQECSAVAEEHGAILVADVGTAELMMAASRVARAIGAGAHAAMATLEFSSGDWQPQTLAESLDNMRDDLRMIMSCCGARTAEELRQGARFVSVRDASGS
jgi:IMP dehydrogenase/GMP reductase